MGCFTADIDQLNPARPAGASVANTNADIQDSKVWLYDIDKQEMFEGVCEVADISDFFLDRPDLGTTFEAATITDRNACQMTGRVHEGQVQGSGAFGAPDSARNWAILGAGHPEVVHEVLVAGFDFNGVLSVLTNDPWWAHAAECAWNPGWRSLAMVSVAKARAAALSPAGESRFCAPGTAWGGDWEGVDLDERDPIEYLAGADGREALTTDGAWLRVAMRPEVGAMVELPAFSEGEELRAEVAAAVRPVGMSWNDSCAVAKAFTRGSYLAAVGDEPRSGQPEGGIWFADAAGHLLDAQGVNHGPMSCQSQVNLTTLFGSEVSVRPYMAHDLGRMAASLSVSAVIPVNARYAGVFWSIPGCPGNNCNPAMGSVSFEMKTATDPQVVPAYAGVSDAFSYDPGVPLSSQTSFPRACESDQWFYLSSSEALDFNHTSTEEDDLLEQAECLCLYADDRYLDNICVY